MTPTDPKYTAILDLHSMLIKARIPHTLDAFMDGWQIVYPNEEHRVMDAVQHCGSYGRQNNLIEIMGLLTSKEEQRDEVAGWLTAANVFNRIRRHWKSVKEEI